MMDTVGNKAARAEIAMIKIVAARLPIRWWTWLSGPAAAAWPSRSHLRPCYARTLRPADGPDEVHCAQLARFELARHAAHDGSRTGGSGEVVVAGFDYAMES